MPRAVERGEALRVAEAVAPVRGQAFGGPPHIAFAFQHLARRVAGRRPAALVGQVNRFGMVENLVGELRPRQLNAALLGVGSAALRIDFFLQGALEFLAGEGRALPGHGLEDAAGVAPGDRVAQLVHILAAFELHAAVFALVFERPCRQFAMAGGEVVGAAGVGIDLRGDDVKVRIVLVVMGDKKRFGVPHAEGGKGLVRGLLHLLAVGRLPARPCER